MPYSWNKNWFRIIISYYLARLIIILDENRKRWQCTTYATQNVCWRVRVSVQIFSFRRRSDDIIQRNQVDIEKKTWTFFFFLFCFIYCLLVPNFSANSFHRIFTHSSIQYTAISNSWNISPAFAITYTPRETHTRTHEASLRRAQTMS